MEPHGRRELIRATAALGVSGLAGCSARRGNEMDPEIETSFSVAEARASGIASANGFLWIGPGSDGSVYEIDSTSGEIVSETAVSTPDDVGGSGGLAHDGESLWVAGSRTIHRVDPSSGRVRDGFAAPGPSPGGLSWDGDSLWHANTTDDGVPQVHQLNRTGGVIDSRTPPYGIDFVDSIAWAEGPSPNPAEARVRSLWLVADRLHEVDPRDMEFRTEDVTVDGGTLRVSGSTGLTCDGDHLWHKTTRSSDTKTLIQRISLSYL